MRTCELADPDIEGLEEVLRRDDLDYVSTRLHAGIRFLNLGYRFLIVAVDNRARQIGADTLPVIERSDIADGTLDAWVKNPVASDV